MEELDRRTFVGALGAGSLALAAMAAEGKAAPASPVEPLPVEPLPADRPDYPGDAGTIYSEVKTLADQCRYPLSWLEKDYPNAAAYSRAVREKVLELFHYSPPPVAPNAEVVGRWETSDYIQEKILFSTTPWFRVPAYVLIPKSGKTPRPAIVDLHSHGGMFVYGKEKVMPVPDGDPQVITNYRIANYEGRSTSQALCRRGYVVISIDCFYFGERRTMFDGDLQKYGRDRSKYSPEDVAYLNHKSSEGESTLARSLYWAGTTWQGVAHWDDIRTVDYLASRPEVDPKRIGCLGISMGGDRTDYLAGLDERIQCAVSVGWMSTLRPMIRAHVDTHSFMHFLPGLTRFLDLPDLLAAITPKPLMVQQCERDALYPIEGMKESVKKIAAIYDKAGAGSKFEAKFYDVPHIFSVTMQENAFDFLDRTLKP